MGVGNKLPLFVPASRLVETENEDDDNFYPSGLDEPMPSTDFHVNVLIYFLYALRTIFHDRPEVYVAGDNFIYYEKGKPYKRISPDCYVVFGAGSQLRDKYLLWKEENKVPNVAFEFLSPSNRLRDEVEKHQLYEALGIQEYFIYDPTKPIHSQNPVGYRLVGGRYQQIISHHGDLHSQQLNVDIRNIEGEVRLYDHRTKKLILPYQDLWYELQESIRREIDAKRRAEEAERQRELADTQSKREAQLRIELEQHFVREQEQRKQAEERSKSDNQRRLEAEERAEQEAKLHAETLLEMAHLKAELERLKQQHN